MSKKDLEKFSIAVAIRVIYIKMIWDSTLYLSEWLRLRTHVTAYVGEDKEQRKYSSIASGNENLYSDFGYYYGVFSEN